MIWDWIVPDRALRISHLGDGHKHPDIERPSPGVAIYHEDAWKRRRRVALAAALAQSRLKLTKGQLQTLRQARRR